MVVRRYSLLLAVASLVIAACSGGGTGTAVTPSSSTGSAGSSAPSSTGIRIDVKLTDALRIEAATTTVPAGVPITFVVTNTGATEHEFYLGDEGAQAEHEKDMVEMGGMAHGEPEGMAVKPGETKELTYTFARAGATLAGCHVAGHYAGGMKVGITVTG